MVVVWIPTRLAFSAIHLPALLAASVCGVLALAAYIATLRFGFRDLYNSMYDVAMMMLHRKRRRGQARPVNRGLAADERGAQAPQ